MKSFIEFKQKLNENRVGIYGSSIVFATRIKNLADKIRNEKNPNKKLDYISQQNHLLALMNGLNFSLKNNKKYSNHRRKIR